MTPSPQLYSFIPPSAQEMRSGSCVVISLYSTLFNPDLSHKSRLGTYLMTRAQKPALIVPWVTWFEIIKSII